MNTDRNQHERARGPRIAAAWLGIAALALAAAGCSMGGAGSAYVAPTAPVASAAAAPAAGQAIAAQSTSLGVILVDSNGRTLYEFANDTNGNSACTGQCATNWPPVAAPSPLPTSLAGVTGQIGMITREDGTSQLTIAGHPLYTFAGDTAPGQTNGQGKTLDGGLWTVVSATGAPVANANPAAATSAPRWPPATDSCAEAGPSACLRSPPRRRKRCPGRGRRNRTRCDPTSSARHPSPTTSCPTRTAATVDCPRFRAATR